jgi:hypothetical protein
LARTSVPVTVFTSDSQEVGAAYVTIDSTVVTNGIVIPNAGKYRRIEIVIRNTAGSAKVATLKAGAASLARSCLGDLAQSVALTTGEVHIFPESMRFEQADESLLIDLASGFTGSIAVFANPASV